jgi:hypothetical protein
MSQDSSVSKVIGYRLVDQDLISGKGRNFFSLPCLDGLWGKHCVITHEPDLTFTFKIVMLNN